MTFSDHLVSTTHIVNGTSEFGEVRYRAFGATRFTSGTTPTTFRYTGQREESALGLYYYAPRGPPRWYDPALGHFIQPDTLLPDADNTLDYHRYGYARFNALKYTDPSGHAGCTVTAAPVMLQDPGFCSGGIGGIILVALVQATNTGAPMVAQWGDKAYAMADGVYQMAQQASQSGAGQSNAGNSSTGDPNGLDPNRIPKGFENVKQFKEFGSKLYKGLEQAGYGDTKVVVRGSSVTGVSHDGKPFDVGRISDYDLALTGESLVRKAQELGVRFSAGGGTRSAPLKEPDLIRLGLDKLAGELSIQAGRPVSFMIYTSLEAIQKRGPNIIVPR